MKPVKEKRASERNPAEAPIRFALLNEDATMPGRLCDFGEGGLGFRCHRPMKEGAVVCIKLCGGGCFAADRPGPRSISLAQIRWCREAGEGPDFTFVFGAKYF